MALSKDDVKSITGLNHSRILNHLSRKGIILKEDSRYFKFKDNAMDEKFLIHTIRGNKRITLWKQEAKEYLINISEKSKIEFYHQIKTSLVPASYLPFVRGKKYIVKINKLGKKHMLIESNLGSFLTSALVNHKLLEIGKTYVMIMGETKTTMQEIHNAR